MLKKTVSITASTSDVCPSVSVCLSVKVNGVSPEINATGVLIDPTQVQQRCSPYGTAETVCACAIGISSVDCACVYEGVCVWSAQ